MGIRRGSISTPIITDGLYFHLDAANRASYPRTGTKVYNTISPISGSFINNTSVDYSVGQGVFDFDGIDDAIYLEGTDNANSWLIPSNSTDPFSISVWFNTDNTSNSQYLVSAAQGGGSNWALRIVSNIVRFRLRRSQQNDPFYADIDTTTTLSNNTWYNAVGVFTGSQTKLYLNGLEDTTPYTTTFYRQTNSTNGTIGVYWYNGGPWQSNDMDGQIGPISFYKSKALSANEVLHNYNALKSRFGL